MPQPTPGRFPGPPALAGALLLLLAGACGGGGSSSVGPAPGAGAVIQVSPASVLTTPGQVVGFSATQTRAGTLLWSVQPAGAGTIDATGRFQAGATPGQCTVVARWGPDPAFSGSASVSILAQPLATHINPNLSEVDGGSQASADGTVRNQSVIGEDVAATRAASPDGRLVLRHGFDPGLHQASP